VHRAPAGADGWSMTPGALAPRTAGLDAAIEMVVGLAGVVERVHTGEDLVPALAEAAKLAARGLGFGAVTINLHRPLHDDFPVVVTEGPSAEQQAILGTSVPRRAVEAVLHPRFAREGCFLLLAGEVDWAELYDAPMFTPEIEASADPRHWNAEDALVLALRGRDGDLLGLMWLDEPLDGLRPDDDLLRLAAVIGRHAAHAIEEAMAAVLGQEHRIALGRLLEDSLLGGDRSEDEVLAALRASVREALGFAEVDVALPGGPGSGAIEGLVAASAQRHGCHLVAPAVAPAAPRAWSEHLLLVPLRDGDGALLGVLTADGPADGLLPGEDRLQALRLFADQAATALTRSRRRAALHALARRDDLTGLGNRAALDDELAARRTAGAPFGVALCDLDDFKAINDAAGHLAGDDALRRAARALSGAALGPAFRLGGDEFCVVLDARTVARTAEAAAALGEALSREGLRASFGCAVHRAREAAPTLLARADARLYLAKGRDR
jgi:diguanylate cyclase (GGDEF)-like protein